MVGGEAILYTEQGEVWGITEELYDTLDPNDDDLLARCTAAQASCAVPFSPLTCNVSCLDQINVGHIKAALAEVEAQFGAGQICPGASWVPTKTFNDRLIDVTPFDFEEHGMPPFPVRWCILTTVPRKNIFRAIDRAKASSTSVFVAAIAGAVIAVLLMGQALLSASLARHRLEREKHASKVARVTQAATGVTSCRFSVCFCRYTKVAKHGRLIPHEEALVHGDLVFLHTYQDVLAFVSVFPTIFFSHQWLAYDVPDPSEAHFSAICDAAEALFSQHDIERESAFIWIDYTSIPQRNPILKGLSIASLGVYASVCKYFVVIAPPTISHATKQECNAETYQRRGWCRLEQWARLAVGGFTHMYLWEGNHLEPLLNKPKWAYDSVHVFAGEFTNVEDKKSLVDTVCGVWAHALRMKSADSHLLNELVQKHKATVFPQEYFGDLIEIMEARIDTLDFQELVVRSSELPRELQKLPMDIKSNWSPTVKQGVSLRELITDTVSASAFAGALTQGVSERKAQTVTV